MTRPIPLHTLKLSFIFVLYEFVRIVFCVVVCIASVVVSVVVVDVWCCGWRAMWECAPVLLEQSLLHSLVWTPGERWLSVFPDSLTEYIHTSGRNTEWTNRVKTDRRKSEGETMRNLLRISNCIVRRCLSTNKQELAMLQQDTIVKR